MTKEEIMKIIKNKGNMEIDPNGNDWCEIRGEDIFYIADELLKLIEQEKKEEINKVLKNSPGVTYIDISEQFVEECKIETKNAKKEVLKEFVEWYKVHLNDLVKYEKDLYADALFYSHYSTIEYHKGTINTLDSLLSHIEVDLKRFLEEKQ